MEIFAEEPTADTSHTTKTTCQSSPLHLISNCDIMTLVGDEKRGKSMDFF